MILLSHPTGNEFVRAILAGLEKEGNLALFQTTVSIHESDWFLQFIPKLVRDKILRRAYLLPKNKIKRRPLRELIRLALSMSSVDFIRKHETGWTSVDSVWRDLDRHVANHLKCVLNRNNISAVYCYEDGAFDTFNTVKQYGLKCIYDLPIAYWKTSQKLLREEADRLPEWEPTLIGVRDSQMKLERKTKELNLADLIICPSKFVYNSLPEEIRLIKKCVVAEFGSPDIQGEPQKSPARKKSSFRFLFVGSMTQRKGLADLFTAMKLLNRSDIELVVMGSHVVPMEFYRNQYSDFIYEPTRHHQAVLELMRSCDVLVLPSIVEGRALVQQEAMSCGLPLIITQNTGGEDLIDNGETGFVVPIRSPEAIAEKIAWFTDHRERIAEMGDLAQRKARQYTWSNYCQKIINAIRSLEKPYETSTSH